MMRRCLKCMTPLPEGVGTCPVCGRVHGAWVSESFALRPGTILDGKYLVGEMLGQGGFGITYLGFDLLLEQKVAIKEYFPMSTGMVSREGQSTVVWSSAMIGKTGSERGFDSFLKEARKMAKLDRIPGVVGVKSVFIENETAYIVMDFIEGETLLKKLRREGPMDFDTCVALLLPMIHSLAQVHSHGIIHRDISPDNIMVQPDGTLMLLDLGAAKEMNLQKADGTIASSQLVAKHGFSPFEQYSHTDEIGPWTDVYAMAATIYHCCTGRVPPTAIDRVVSDTLTCQPRLTREQFRRLEPALAIPSKDRIQTMDALANVLGKKQPTPHTQHIQHTPNIQPTPAPPVKWFAIVALLLTALLCGILLIRQETPDTLEQTQTNPATISIRDTAPKETTPRPRETLPVQTISPKETEPATVAPVERTYVQVDGGLRHTVVLYNDGTVEAVGCNTDGQCDVSQWRDIVQISTLKNHTVGLKSDGTVVAVGDNTDGQCEVSQWRDIIAVSAGEHHTVGLKSDGTVVAVGKNRFGECEVEQWSDVVAIGAAYSNTFGLCSDGTVIAAGSIRKGKLPGWKNIKRISVSDAHIVGLCADGTVKAAGQNNHGQCDLEDWSGIVDISAGCAYTVGLKRDGSVVVKGIDDVGQLEAENWKNIACIATGLEHTIGVKEDGTFVAVGANDWDQCEVSQFSQG